MPPPSPPREAPPGFRLLFASWVVVCGAAAGSIFLSAVMGLTPCSLCWYQRVALFPLTLVLGVGLLGGGAEASRYGLPLAGAGWLVAAYHNALQVGLIPADLVPCSAGVSCSERLAIFDGLVSIPLLSLGTFSLVLALLVAHRRRYAQ